MPATKKKKTPKPKETAQTRATTGKKKWSAKVMRESDALDLKGGLFKQKDPHKVALSLKRSAERSKRRKGTPYQSAMSMLTFHINRGGKTLPAGQKKVLEKAKGELRDLFGK
jgi:hypothetical protein